MREPQQLVFISPMASLFDASLIFLKNKIHRLPLIESERIKRQSIVGLGSDPVSNHEIHCCQLHGKAGHAAEFTP